MLLRLGNVLYWLCCGIAAIAVIVGAFAGSIALGAFGGSTNPGDQIFIAICLLIFGASSWVIGRAFRYVLGGF